MESVKWLAGEVDVDRQSRQLEKVHNFAVIDDLSAGK